MRFVLFIVLVTVAGCQEEPRTNTPDAAAVASSESAPPPSRGAHWTTAETVIRSVPEPTAESVSVMAANTRLLASSEPANGWVAIYHPRPTYDTLGFVREDELTDQRPPVPIAGRLMRLGDAFHVTGCENGRLELPTVNLWASPDFTRVIGRLSGDGRADQGLSCQGAVVALRDVAERNGRQVLQVQSVVNGTTGWFTDSFVGRSFPRERCADFFAGDPAAVERCKGRQ